MYKGAIAIVILLLLSTFAGCKIMKAADQKTDQLFEQVVDAINENDMEAAYALTIQELIDKEKFAKDFDAIQALWGEEMDYEYVQAGIKMEVEPGLKIYIATYVVTKSDDTNFVVTISRAEYKTGQEGIYNLNIQPAVIQEAA